MAEALPSRALAQDRLAQIITNVEGNEQLYQNLEVILRTSYSLDKSVSDYTPKHLRSSERTRRCVLQSNKIFLKKTQSDLNVEGKSHKGEMVQGYDGEWLLSRAFVSFPLSVWF